MDDFFKGLGIGVKIVYAGDLKTKVHLACQALEKKMIVTIRQCTDDEFAEFNETSMRVEDPGPALAGVPNDNN